MMSDTQEDYLNEAWLSCDTTYIYNSDLLLPVIEAREELVGCDEERVRRLFRHFENVGRFTRTHRGAERALRLHYEVTKTQKFAILILGYAAAGMVDRVKDFHEVFLRLKSRELESDAKIGKSSREGSKKRDDYHDKQFVLAIAKSYWKNKPSASIKEVENSNQLKAFKNKYKGANTLKGWLREVDTRPPEKKRGRRPKK